MTILDVESDKGDGLTRIVLRGELDLSTVGKVETELQEAEAAHPPVLVIDLAGLTFLDSTGLRLVATAHLRAQEDGRRLVLVRGPEAVDRVFTITRLGERLEIVDDVSALRSAE